MDNVGESLGLVFALAIWLLPIAVLVYVLRALHTIILGMRSINQAAERTAEAVERIEARGRGLS
ncbi:MAG: hypothetical protein ACR2G7_07600 [Acidimicrobiales bacterium]